MTMRQIEIDDEVFSVIQQHAVPLVDDANAVLRRLLLNGGGPAAAKPRLSGPTGDLLPFIRAGLLQSGDVLVHDQPRKGLVHRGVVTENGCIEANGQTFQKVSPALKACVGNEINGWGNWHVERTGSVLQSVRDEYRRAQNG